MMAGGWLGEPKREHRIRDRAAGHDEGTFRFPENVNHVPKQELRRRSALVAAEIAESYNGPDSRLDP